MKVAEFLENFRYIAEAPNGVNQLRQMILQLAVSASLVPQRDGEAPATDAVAQAEKERERYQALHGLRARQFHGAIRDDEKPFSIPDTWQWVRLERIACYIQRGKGPAYATRGDVRVVSQKCIQWTGFDLSPARFVSDGSLDRYGKERFLLKGDVLWNSTGTGTAGRVAVFPGASEPVVADSHVTVVRLTNFLPEYIWCYLASPTVQQRTLPGGDSSLVSGTTNQVELSTAKVAELPIPCPPTDEQERIVAKVGELMALCDKLEAYQQEREQLFPRVATALHSQLSEHPTTELLTAALGGELPGSPEHLRQLVFSLAVQGKLTAQVASDEPASQIVQRIIDRKPPGQRIPDVNDAEKPFAVPENWAWQRLGNLTLGSDAGWSPKCEPSPRTGDAWGVLKVSAVSWGTFLPEENKAVPSHLEGRPNCEVRDGDFLVSRANTADLVARSVIVRNPPPRLMLSDKIVRFQVPDDLDKEYLNLANSSPWAREFYAENATGTSSSMKNVSRATMARLPVPVPPIEEQQRIMVRVAELMAMIQQLEAQQRKRGTVAEAFAQAAVAAIAGTISQEFQPMKAPKTELVTRLQLSPRNRQPGTGEPLAALLAEQDDGLSAKALWQRSGLAIDAFYQQLKTEMAAGWIVEPEPAQMREIETS